MQTDNFRLHIRFSLTSFICFTPSFPHCKRLTNVRFRLWDLVLRCMTFADCRLQTADRRLQTADCMQGTQRRCSAKYLFRIGNSAGWQDIYFHRLRLGITNISSSAGWNRRKYRETGQETGTIYRHQLSQGDLRCPRLIAVTGKAGLNWFEQLLLARAPKSSCNVPWTQSRQISAGNW